LAQVVHFTWSAGLVTLLLLLGLYGAGAFVFYIFISPHIEAVEEAAGNRGDLSRAMSDCLDATKRVSLQLWLGGGLLFAILGTLLVMPTAPGFAYFLVAALIAAFPALAVAYAAGKHQLPTL